MLFANKCLQIAGSLILSFQSKANILNVIIKMYENTPVDFFLKGRKCQGFQHQLKSAALSLEVKLRIRFPWENQVPSCLFFGIVLWAKGKVGLGWQLHVWLLPASRWGPQIMRGDLPQAVRGRLKGDLS